MVVETKSSLVVQTAVVQAALYAHGGQLAMRTAVEGESEGSCVFRSRAGESELWAKLKVGRASLGEEREGSRVADISINAAWAWGSTGGVQKGKTTTSQRHLAAHGLVR